MNPFFFGEKGAQLFGMLHPADGSDFKDECVVLCYPFGQEYERAHRAFKIIANNLSRLGYEVLRFDYSGTGDSSGISEDILISTWKHDIATAIQEAKDCSGSDIVSLVGLRLGATLALQLSKDVEGLKRCICWDPILSGDQYFKEIPNYIEPEYVAALSDVSGNKEIYLNGYPLPVAYRKELLELDMANFVLGAAEYQFITSQQDPELAQVVDKFSAQGSNAKLNTVICESDWNHVDEFGGILIPQPVIAAITDLFK
ncbi:MAG: hypothetical protein MI867_14900 [Pseudomonadales bacterium]|nr:hypothetical protein [Pseudomonadales bacterium]